MWKKSNPTYLGCLFQSYFLSIENWYINFNWQVSKEEREQEAYIITINKWKKSRTNNFPLYGNQLLYPVKAKFEVWDYNPECFM